MIFAGRAVAATAAARTKTVSYKLPFIIQHFVAKVKRARPIFLAFLVQSSNRQSSTAATPPSRSPPKKSRRLRGIVFFARGLS